jgi:hypothetical protein
LAAERKADDLRDNAEPRFSKRVRRLFFLNWRTPMSLEAITAIGRQSADPMQRYTVRNEALDLSMFDPSAQGAHLSTAKLVDPVQAKASVDVRHLFNTFQNGMQHGFTTGDNERIAAKIQDMQQPGSAVKAGELMADLVVAQSKVAVATMIGNLTSKVAEGLQTIVVKQS